MLIILPSKYAKKNLLLFLFLKHQALQWLRIFTRCNSWFVPKHYGNRNFNKVKVHFLVNQRFSLLQKGKAPARQDKSICMRAILLGNFRSRVELLGGQLCCFFWTATSLIWWESNLNEWIEELEKIKRIASGGRRSRKGWEGRKTTQNFRYLEGQRKKLPPKSSQLNQAVTQGEVCVATVTPERD